GMGLSSSLMPSHSWPVVATPLISSISFWLMSIVLERDAGCFVGLFTAAGAEGEDHDTAKEERHEQETPGVGELAQRGVGFHAFLLAQVRGGVVGREIDQRA